MLATLAYRVPADQVDALFGQVTAYPLSEEFAHAWSLLPRGRLDGDHYARPPYGSLAAALQGVHRRPVRLFGAWELSDEELTAGERMLLLTTAPIDTWLLSTAVASWERCVRNGHGSSLLAPLLPGPEASRSFGAFITTRTGCAPNAPGWVFRTAAWEAMRQLAKPPIHVDGRPPIGLRLDTDGSLLAWDDLISNAWSDRTGYAMARIVCRVVTIPGLSDLVIRFDASLTRLDQRWNGVKNAWIDRADARDPILRLGVRHRRDGNATWSTIPRDYTAEVVEACGLERLTLDSQLPTVPGRVRPIVPRARRHPVGRGTGTRFLLRLAEHVQRHLPGVMPLDYQPEKIRLPHRTIGPTPPDILPAAVRATGFDRLLIAVLYQTVEARDRIAKELDKLTTAPVRAIPDGTARQVNKGLSVVFHRTPDLITHGHQDRRPLLDQLPELNGHDALNASWEFMLHGQAPR